MSSSQASDMYDRNRVAFEELHAEAWPVVFTLVYQKLGDRDEAYDLVQDLFIELWEKRHVFPPESITVPWLKRRAWYKLLTHFRTKGFRQKQLDDFSRFVASELECDNNHIPEADFEMIMEAITLIVAKMPERMKQIYLLNKEQHYTVREIADHLDISHHTVRYHLQVAMARLREALSKQGFSAANCLIVLFLIAC